MGACESRPEEKHELQFPKHFSPPQKQNLHPDSPYFQNSTLSPIAALTPNRGLSSQENSLWHTIERGKVPGPNQRHVLTFGKPGGSPSYQDSASSKAENQPKNPFPSAMKADPHYSKPNHEQKERNEHRIFGYNKQDQEDQEEQEEPETPQGWGGQVQPQEINIERFSVSRDSLNEEIDLDEIIYEGYLLKYKPGTNFNWVERWCILTRREFRYYKDQWAAKGWDSKPLSSVAMSDIITTVRVNMNLPEFATKKEVLQAFKDSNLKHLFHFEIFDTLNGNDYLQSDPQSNMSQRSLNATYDTRRSSYEPTAVSAREGYLMRPPMTQKTYRSPSPHNTSKYSSKFSTQTKDTTSSKISPYKQPSSGRTTATSRGEFTSKWVKNKADLSSWTGRENEWFYSEKRLLFATPDSEEREKWVQFLEWALKEDDKNNQ